MHISIFWNSRGLNTDHLKPLKKLRKLGMASEIRDDENPLLSQSQHQSDSSVPPPSVRVKPKRDPVLIVCKCFSFITVLTAILCILVNVISAVTSFKNGSIFDGIFRCYAVAITVFVILAETEWSWFFKYWGVLEYWVGRGMLQIFVGVMTRAFPDVTGRRKEIVDLHDISSYLLLACGATYVILGLLCIGSLKRAHQQKETRRDQAVKDLEEMERRREELEALLIMDRP